METGGLVVSRKVGLKCDLIDMDIPVLLSRAALENMGASISFSDNQLTIEGFCTIQLMKSSSGHLVLPACVDTQTEMAPWHNNICFPTTAAARNPLSSDEIAKIHVQLGHCQARQLSATLMTAGYPIQPEFIADAIQKCGCASVEERSHASIANSHISPYPGYAIFLDIVYIVPNTGHKHPYLMIIDTFSRFFSMRAGT